jgi:sulfite exporter TauE/SafE
VNGALTLGGAFVLGLIASGHCLVMCGGIAGALGVATQRDARGRIRWDLLAGYQVGRICSYALAGLSLGGIGAALIHLVDQDQVRIALRWASALVFAVLGASLLRRGRGIDSRLGRRVWTWLAPHARSLLPVRRFSRAVAVGAVWGWMPCGLVYSVLFLAWLGMDPLRSAAIMLLFGLGTIPAVVMGALGAGRAAQFLARARVRSGVGAMLLLFATLTAAGPWLVHAMPAAAHWLPFDCALP